MATIINNPNDGTERTDGGGTGIIIAAIVLVIILIAFFVYGLPALRNNSGGSGTSGSATINVPDKVDVNVDGQTGQ